MSNENEPRDPHDDEAWAELLSPGRRELILKTGLTAAALVKRKPGPGEPPVELIFPNTRPSVKIESA